MKLFMIACMDAECEAVAGLLLIDAPSLEDAMMSAGLQDAAMGFRVPEVNEVREEERDAVRAVRELPRNLVFSEAMLTGHLRQVAKVVA